MYTSGSWRPTVSPLRISNLRRRRKTALSAAESAIVEAAAAGAQLICFPECYVPGYRSANTNVPPPDPLFLSHAWDAVAAAAARGKIAVVLGTERVADTGS